MDIALIGPMKSSMECMCPEAGIRRTAIKRIITAAPMLFLVVGLAVPQANAVNSVVVESKSFSPGQTACSVGVFVTNDVPIVGLVLPLELRSTSGGAYITGPFPSSFRFRTITGNRIDNSPMGPAGDNWPEAVRIFSYFANPVMSGPTCGGPMTGTYSTATASVDGVSPDGVFYVALTTGNPSLGEEWRLAPGSDPPGTPNASLLFVFNVDTVPGCIRIDTCCRTPSNHLAMVGSGDSGHEELLSVEFDRGLISVGAEGCPGSGNPDDNNLPNAICVESVRVVAESDCSAPVSAELVDNGSWDVEDGTNLFRVLDPPGPYPVGDHLVRFFVCDQDGKCASCTTLIRVEDTIAAAVSIAPDTLFFRFVGNPELDTLCQESPITSHGCITAASIYEQTGFLFSASLKGPFSKPTSLMTCINATLARNAPNGTYFGEVIIGVRNDSQRDTVVVVIELDHPPVEPGCDSVCGFVLSPSGVPVAGARITAYTCTSTGSQCAQVPDAQATSDSGGAFCIQTFGWPHLTLTASAGVFGGGFSRVTVCEGLPTYIFLDQTGPLFPLSGPGALPVCVTHGFVLSSATGEAPSPIVDAQVELWDTYPDGSLVASDSTDEFGHFALGSQSGDIVVRARGYCPVVVEDVVCGFEAILITVDTAPYTPPRSSPLFADYYSTNARFVTGDASYPVMPGDVIYATDPQGVVCGLAVVDEEGSYLIHVFGDMEKTPEDEGAEPGDAITLWLNCECAVVAPDPWLNFGNYQFDPLWDCRPTELCCVLCEGWNMWSYNIQVPDYGRSEVFATIDSNYDAVRSGRCDLGLVSWFEGRPVNDLVSAPPWFGYDVHLLERDTLCLVGDLVDPSTPLYLCAGWNYIPYFPNSPDDLAHALASLEGNYTHIFTMYCDYGVASWNRTRDINDLACLEPCHGYWIELASDDTLIYPVPEGCNFTAKVGTQAIAGRVPATPLVADYFASSSQFAEGAVVSVRNSSGALIGETTVGVNGSFLLHVYGDVPSTPKIEGAIQGETLSFEVNGAAADAGRAIVWRDRDNQEIALTMAVERLLPTEYALLQNYPNPFNAGTVMTFDLIEGAEWALNIYNVMGQRVRSIAGQSAAGRVSVPWDGRDEEGASLATGVYFYRLSANDFTSVKKMLLIK